MFIPGLKQLSRWWIVSLFTAVVAGNIALGSITDVNPIKLFARSGTSIDPITGLVAGANIPNTWEIELPMWQAGQEPHRLIGSKFIVGIGRNGTLYGTRDQLGSAALYASVDEGKTWRHCATLKTQSREDHIAKVVSVPFDTNELLWASMEEGGLYLSVDHASSFSKIIFPRWYAALAPRIVFHYNLLVEAVAGKPVEDCRLLTCFYGQRFEGGMAKTGSLYVFRTDLTLKQMAAGAVPQMELVWKQDYFDYFARHVSGAEVVSNRGGVVSATPRTLSDSANVFGANNDACPRCVRITKGRGVGQSRLIVSCNANKLTVATPWQVLPDATSDYQIINGGVNGQGMHLHSAIWVPRSVNGESNILFVSFGDNISGHVCRIPNFNTLPVDAQGEDHASDGWNYSDSQVFAIRQQPTAMWAKEGKLYFLARDYDGATVVTPDDQFRPETVSEDSFNIRDLFYTGVGYDAIVGSNQVAVAGHLTERTKGQFGIYIGDPVRPQQMFRYVRGLNPSDSTGYVGYNLVLGNPAGDYVIVSGDTFGGGTLTKTWFMPLPQLTRIQAYLVGNATTNLIANADFSEVMDSAPTHWRRVASAPADSVVYAGTNIFGGGRAWRVTQNDPEATTIFNLDPSLTDISTSRTLCVSFAYRLASQLKTTYSTPVALRVDWSSPAHDSRIDMINGLDIQTTNQWHFCHFSSVAPPEATRGQFQYQFRNFQGSVEVAMPSASWNHYTLPTAGIRSQDILEFDSPVAPWNTHPKSHVEFLTVPLWPKDWDSGVSETLCSMESDDRSHFLFTWDYHSGFQARLQADDGKDLLTLDLGQLHTLTRLDPCRVSVDFEHGTLAVQLVAGSDVLRATGQTTVRDRFSPVKIRLGSDQFAGGNPGWEGYYALLTCEALD
jgi:hypothetical protein